MRSDVAEPKRRTRSSGPGAWRRQEEAPTRCGIIADPPCSRESALGALVCRQMTTSDRDEGFRVTTREGRFGKGLRVARDRCAIFATRHFPTFSGL